MKFWLSPYTLKMKRGGERSGFLLKVQTDDDTFGYADIFPWPEFGDPPLRDISKSLIKNPQPPLLQRSLFFAKQDALARSQNRPLGQALTLNNHGLALGEPQTWLPQVEEFYARGFTKIKLKMGSIPHEERKALRQLLAFKNDEPWLRLDFNGRAQTSYLQEIVDLIPIVEFIEDPFEHPEDWKNSPWTWAFDQAPFLPEKCEYKYRIVKPAKMKTPQAKKANVVFTSYMDHPVGLVHACFQADSFGPQSLEYGLLSHEIYEKTEFHETLLVSGSQLNYSADRGIGLEYLLEKQKWMAIDE